MGHYQVLKITLGEGSVLRPVISRFYKRLTRFFSVIHIIMFADDTVITVSRQDKKTLSEKINIMVTKSF